MLTQHHWAKNLHDAGYQPTRMKFPQELNVYVSMIKASRLDGGHRLCSGIERDLPCDIAQDTPHENDNHNSIHTGSVVAQNKDRAFHCWPSGRGEKYMTDGPKPLRTRNSITIGTWNVRSLSATGKVEELTHEMKRYRWYIPGLCEVRWKKNF